MNRIERRIKGALRYELCGVQPEALLNACALEGLPFSELEIVDAYTLRLTIPEDERARLEALSPRCRCELRPLGGTGGRTARRALRRRWPLLLAAALLLLGLLVSSLFIWEIELIGRESLSRGLLLRALEDAGVAPGAFRPGLDADEVRSRVLERVPELAWMTVNVRGSRASVLLLERSDKPEIYREKDAADVTAKCAGIVRRVSVLNGRPLVRPGQAVLRGETLVSGVMDSLTNAPRGVRARAEVLADTWYEITALCPAGRLKETDGGTAQRRYALVVGKTRVNFYGKGGKALDGYDKIIREHRLAVKGLFSTPLCLVCEELRPYEARAAAFSAPEELQQRLFGELNAQIRGEIVSASFSVSEGDALLGVSLHAACREDIAKTVDIIP